MLPREKVRTTHVLFSLTLASVSHLYESFKVEIVTKRIFLRNLKGELFYIFL